MARKEKTGDLLANIDSLSAGMHIAHTVSLELVWHLSRSLTEIRPHNPIWSGFDSGFPILVRFCFSMFYCWKRNPWDQNRSLDTTLRSTAQWIHWQKYPQITLYTVMSLVNYKFAVAFERNLTDILILQTNKVTWRYSCCRSCSQLRYTRSGGKFSAPAAWRVARPSSMSSLWVKTTNILLSRIDCFNLFGIRYW